MSHTARIFLHRVVALCVLLSDRILRYEREITIKSHLIRSIGINTSEIEPQGSCRTEQTPSQNGKYCVPRLALIGLVGIISHCTLVLDDFVVFGIRSRRKTADWRQPWR